MMRFKSLGSGSSGNATLVQATGWDRCNLLIDCGFGLRPLLQRLQKSGVLPDQLDAIFITHEHGDHTGCVQALSNQFNIPVWMSAGTATAMGFDNASGLLRTAADGDVIALTGLQLCPFTVPHDAREPLQLTCTDGATKLGVLTDLGHATTHVLDQLQGCHALILECNHDADLLAASVYPPFLKQRVGGHYGHLANSQAAGIARTILHSRLKHVVAAHLSQQNNSPELVKSSLAQALSCKAEDIIIATQNDGCAWLAT
jgi:phosphoribosyl 1,2-cyclic phosphodiesterase